MNSNRRRFLKMSSDALFAAAISSIGFPNVVRGVQKKYKAAIIGRTGRGDYGHSLDLVFKDLDKVTVVAVADDDKDGLRRAAGRSGALRQYLDYREMLEKEHPDIVSIASRQPDCHREMALACIENGAHIYMEKPVTEYPSEADNIVNAARGKGIKVGIAHHRRYLHEFLALKELLDEGIIGTVLEARFYGKQDTRVGAEDFIVLGAHDMDSMRYYFGDPLWCFGSVTNNGKDITPRDVHKGQEPYTIAGNTIRAQYAFPNNIQAYWSSIAAGDGWNETASVPGDPIAGRQKWGFDIFGSKGIITHRPGNGIKYMQLWYVDSGDKAIQWKELPVQTKHYPPHKTHPIKNLIHAIENNMESACSAADARWTIEMVSGVYQSQINKKRIYFPLEFRRHPLMNYK